MKQVLITFAEKPTKDYPLAVVVIDDDGKRSQEYLVRCVRDGRILGNGICAGAMMSDNDRRIPSNERIWPVNPDVDPRMTEATQ